MEAQSKSFPPAPTNSFWLAEFPDNFPVTSDKISVASDNFCLNPTDFREILQILVGILQISVGILQIFGGIRQLWAKSYKFKVKFYKIRVKSYNFPLRKRSVPQRIANLLGHGEDDPEKLVQPFGALGQLLRQQMAHKCFCANSCVAIPVYVSGFVVNRAVGEKSTTR